jgi:sugar/nucleoside kinase (ribokinase family)
MISRDYRRTSPGGLKEDVPPIEVMTLADVCVDLILTGDVRPRFHQVEQFVDDLSLQLGGSAAIFASQMARLGVSTALVGWVGADLFGDFVLSELEKAGVDIARLKKHPTVKTCVGLALSEKNDRAILTYSGTLNVSSPDDLNPELLKSCRHWHIAGYFLMRHLQPAWVNWLELCRRSGITTSLDTNWDPAERWEGVCELLPLIDVFLPNEAEALAISQQTDVFSAARTLAQRGSLVVVKRGENGALAVKGDDFWELRMSESQIRPNHIVDTTGAGDNFDAGFLRAWLRTEKIDDCLTLAHKCAVSSLGYLGGVAGQICESDIASNGTSLEICK